MTLKPKGDAKCEEKPKRNKKLICCFKNDTDFVNLTRALESLKVYNDSPKKVQSYLTWH